MGAAEETGQERGRGERDGLRLYPYQDHDAGIIAARRGNILAYEAGGGKTPTALIAAERGNPKAPWWICTVRNAKKQWQEHLAQWVPGKKNVTLTHYEEAHMVTNAGVNAGVVILDEGDRAANVETETFKKVYNVCRYSASNYPPKKIIYATATPVHNGPKDLLAPLILTGVYNLEQYQQALIYFCDPIFEGFGGRLDARGASNIDELRRVLSLVMIRRKYSDFGRPMPPLSFENVPCQADATPAGRQYEAALGDFKAWYQSTQGRAVPPMAKYSIQRRLLAMSKIGTVERELKAELAAGGDHNFLVFSEFREPVEELHGRFKGSGLVIGGDSDGARDRVVEAAKGAAGGHITFATTGSLDSALNIQSTDRVYYNDLGWTPRDFDQTYKRAWRAGQTRAVKIRRFFIPEDPLEKFIRDVLLTKEKTLELLGLDATGTLTQFGLA